MERRERRERRGHGKPLQTPSQTRPSPPTSPPPAPPTLPFPSHTDPPPSSSPPTSHSFAPPGRGQTPSTNIRAKRREPLPDLLLLPVHLAEPRVGARRRCAPPGPSSGLWSRRRPWRGGRRGRNDAEALVVVRVSDKDKAGCWPPQPPRLRLKRAKASRARWGGAGWRA